MNRKTKKFYYLECKVKSIGMKKYRFFGAKQINSILCPRQLIDLDVSNFEYRIFVVVFSAGRRSGKKNTSNTVRAPL